MAVTAYGALVSLKHIIDQLHHHPSPPIAIDKLQLQSLTENITSLLEFLEGYNFHGDTNETDHLASGITKAAYAAEDVIESYIVENIRLAAPTLAIEGRGEGWLAITIYQFCNIVKYNTFALSKKQFWIRYTIFYGDLQKVIEEMDSIKKEAMKKTTEKAAVQDLQQQQRRPDVFPGSASTGLNNETMVGFDDVLLDGLKKLETDERIRRVIPIVGMGGIGKTTLAKKLYSDSLFKKHFDICVWVTISQEFNAKEILCEVLSHAKKESREQFLRMSESELEEEVHKCLFNRRYLVVMDDVWSLDSWNKIQCFFPDNGNGSRVLVTTRLSTIGSQLDNKNGIELKFLGEDSSWILFSKTVFGEKTFPYELKDIGKEIVGGCKGLPLSIVVIGGLLRKLEHTQKCWESVRRKINSVVNLENDEYCLKILKMSYNHLPVYLKPCFLYMGVFEEDTEIHVQTLCRLWISEGFLKPQSGKSLETTAEEFFKDLVGRNLLLVSKLKSNGDIKYCKIHDLLREMCLREVEKEKFFNVIEPKCYDDIPQGRRFVIPKSTSDKQLCRIVAVNAVSYARSLICDNENARLKPNCRLLRSLHARDMFKNEYRYDENLLDDMFELVNLRYLDVGVRTDSEFPSSINLLWNLHTIIVKNHSEVNAPTEIWKIPQLKHVNFIGGVRLPDPPSGNDDIVIMKNLQSLGKLQNFKCSKEVVERIPNIKKLRVEYKGDGNYCLNNLESLDKLESFILYSRREDDCIHSLTFPQSLQKLTLTGIGFDCEKVLEKTGSLPDLRKLVLEGGFFKTSKWKTVEGEFCSLRFLVLQWCKNLKEWEMEKCSHFPCLEHLLLVGLELLEEIPLEIGEISTLISVKLDSCTSSAVESLKGIVEDQRSNQDPLSFHAQVWLTWEQKEQKALQRLAAPNFEVN